MGLGKIIILIPLYSSLDLPIPCIQYLFASKEYIMPDTKLTQWYASTPTLLSKSKNNVHLASESPNNIKACRITAYLKRNKPPQEEPLPQKTLPERVIKKMTNSVKYIWCSKGSSLKKETSPPPEVLTQPALKPLPKENDLIQFMPEHTGQLTPPQKCRGGPVCTWPENTRRFPTSRSLRLGNRVLPDIKRPSKGSDTTLKGYSSHSRAP